MSAMGYGAVFLLGGLGYGAIEYLWRGRTHWTMLALGGTCAAFMALAASSALPLPAQAALSAADITAAEFLTGALVNRRLGWGVWDYSDEPMNLYGQICPRYSLLWLALSVPGCALMGLLIREGL